MKNFMILLLAIALAILYASCSPKRQGATVDITPMQMAVTVMPSVSDFASATPAEHQINVDKDKIFKTWMQGYLDCTLPCWAGITPGRTSWEDAIAIISDVTTPHVATEYSVCRYGNCKSLDWQYEFNGKLYSGLIYEKNKLVYSLYITGEEADRFDVYETLNRYGQPDQILLSASSFTLEGQPTLSAILLYKEKKFIVRYMWWAEFEGDFIVACGSSSIFSLGIVDVGGDNWTSIEITQAGRQLSIGTTVENFKPISDVSELTETDFYQLGMQSLENFCISTPVIYWK